MVVGARRAAWSILETAESAGIFSGENLLRREVKGKWLDWSELTGSNSNNHSFQPS